VACPWWRQSSPRRTLPLRSLLSLSRLAAASTRSDLCGWRRCGRAAAEASLDAGARQEGRRDMAGWICHEADLAAAGSRGEGVGSGGEQEAAASAACGRRRRCVEGGDGGRPAGGWVLAIWPLGLGSRREVGGGGRGRSGAVGEMEGGRSLGLGERLREGGWLGPWWQLGLEGIGGSFDCRLVAGRCRDGHRAACFRAVIWAGPLCRGSGPGTNRLSGRAGTKPY
jgi:hypothetical protein